MEPNQNNRTCLKRTRIITQCEYRGQATPCARPCYAEMRQCVFSAREPAENTLAHTHVQGGILPTFEDGMQNNSPLNAQHGKGVAQTAATTATPAAVTVTEPRETGGAGPAFGATAGAVAHSPSNALTESAPSSPSSAYSSWTVPSLDSLFSARRASAFGARYGLVPSHASTQTPGRKSPATSSMSLILEGGPGVASLQSKARKISAHMSESITSALNDSSLVFYRVNEHIHKKVPQLVEEKKALAAVRKSVETANQDLEDARQTISGMQRITELESIEALVKRALVAVQK